MTFSFAPAVRESVSLLIALAGASGSGKTYSALRLAKGMSPAGKIAFIDTEARRGLHYADQFNFRHCDMRPPFTPERFVEAIRAAEGDGAEVVVIDNFSDEYEGEGGIMDFAAQLEEGTPKPGIEHPRASSREGHDWWKDWLVKPVASPGSFKEPKRVHKKMMNTLLQFRAQLIFCLRADEKIKIEKDLKGKTVVKPLGWMPICEKRFMGNMTLSFTLTPEAPGKPRLDLPHKLQSQHRDMFSDQKPIGEDSGLALAEWARGGKPAPTRAEFKPSEPMAEELTAAEWDMRLGDAAKQGKAAMRAVYAQIPRAMRPEIDPTLDRHVKAAEAADRVSA